VALLDDVRQLMRQQPGMALKGDLGSRVDVASVGGCERIGTGDEPMRA
jgi:hypothetical protein